MKRTSEIKFYKHNILFINIAFLFMIACGDNGSEPKEPDTLNNKTIYSVESYNEIVTSPEFEFHPRWSNDGSKIAFARFNPETSELGLWVWEKSTGSINLITTGLKGDVSPTWRHDDSLIAYDARDGNDVSRIYIVKILDSSVRVFTSGQNAFRPCWSKNGSKIAYISQNSVFVKDINGGSAQKVEGSEGAWNPEWNADGTKILFTTPGSNATVNIIKEDGSNLQKLFTTPSSGEVWTKWSPDNSHIIYDKESGDNSNLFVYELSTGNENALTTSNDCRFLDWSPNELFIVYVEGDNLWEMKLARNE